MEKTNELIDRACKCAIEHGFHDTMKSKEAMLMLVLSEIGEAVEADRRECYGHLGEYEKMMEANGDFLNNFKIYVKDSLPDELADICIRLYDMCGWFNIEPRVEYDTMETDFQEIFGDDTFCERMYYLSRLLCSTNCVRRDDGTDECLPQVIGSALSFLFALANDMGIDLMYHIELKMRYNEERPYLHDKKY